jgi:hypothetical protein
LIPIDLAILAEWTAIDKIPDKPLNRNNMLFTYLDLGGLPGVARWLEAAAHHRTTLGRVMGTVYAQGMFISDQLLNRAAALEAFDRLNTGMNNSKFKTRLKRCVSLAGPLFEDLVGDVERWAETVRWDRDDVAHHYGRRMKQATLEQRFVGDSLYWLYVLCILRKAGAPSAVFDGIARQERFRWLAPRIRAAGAPKEI